MVCKTFAPSPSLAGIVQKIWVLESGEADNSVKIFNPVSTGCPGIIFQQTERGMSCNGGITQLPVVFAYGQTVAPPKIEASGKLQAIGIYFYPHALNSVFGFNAHELTNSYADLNHILLENDSFLNEKLVNENSINEKIQLLSSCILKNQKKNNNNEDKLIKYCQQIITNSCGDASLKELHCYTQLSERSFERRFKAVVGISPNLFSRICRFQASLEQMRKATYKNISDIAYKYGYSDQSHFTRAFKEFTGFIPYKFMKHNNEIVENLPLMAN